MRDDFNKAGCEIIIKEVFDEIRRTITHIKPCCQITLDAIEKKFTK